MARNGKMMAHPAPMMADPMYQPLTEACIPCLEDDGLWYTAQRVRLGETVYPYEIEEALEHSDKHYQGKHPTMQAVPPIRNSAGTNSVAAMMSEGCPPNTGRRYDKV